MVTPYNFSGRWDFTFYRVQHCIMPDFFSDHSSEDISFCINFPSFCEIMPLKLVHFIIPQLRIPPSPLSQIKINSPETSSSWSRISIGIIAILPDRSIKCFKTILILFFSHFYSKLNTINSLVYNFWISGIWVDIFTFFPHSQYFKKATWQYSLLLSLYITKILCNVLFAESGFLYAELLSLKFWTQEQCQVFYPCYVFFLVRSDMLLSVCIFWILILSPVIFINTSIFLSTASVPSLPFPSLPEPLIKTFNQEGPRIGPLCISGPGWHWSFDKYFWYL